MSRRPVPPDRRRVHLVTPNGGVTACGRAVDDPAVTGYTTTDPSAATCGACHLDPDAPELPGMWDEPDGEDTPPAPDAPVLPYAGTSGWSGSGTSHDRADREDHDGTTSHRQAETPRLLGYFYPNPKMGHPVGQHLGMTWRELADLTGWHHGQASGVLSVLHKTGHIARLTERRNRCAIYVLPEYVQGRETAAHGGRRSYRADADALADALATLLTEPGSTAEAWRAANDAARVLAAYRARTSAKD